MARRRHEDNGGHKKHRGHKKKPPPKKKPGAPPPPQPTLTEAASFESGYQLPPGTPEQQPQNPPNEDAVFTTGPGQAVEYHYNRMGTYAEDYAAQQDAFNTTERAPAMGPGQVTTGAANNPT